MKGTKWALGFAMMILGLLLSIQMRMSQEASTDPSRLRANELSTQLRATEARLEASERERLRLEKRVVELELSLETGASPDLTQRDYRLELLAGTVPMRGPGVVVTITEASMEGGLPLTTRVTDEDLWRVINELLSAGAEGIAVNGERITAISGIRNVQQRIMVNQKMVVSPIRIEAVGDPVVLEAALRLRGGVIELGERWGLRFNVQRSDALTLPAYGLDPTFRFGRAAP